MAERFLVNHNGRYMRLTDGALPRPHPRPAIGHVAPERVPTESCGTKAGVWSIGCGSAELVQHRVLICDRDAKWSACVRTRLGESGIRVVRTPHQAPNANDYAERFVRSIKQECLNRLIPIGERHLRGAVTEFVAHCHHERNHQGIENALIADAPGTSTEGRIRRRPRLGGLLNCYGRAA